MSLAFMRFEGSYTDYLSAFNLAAPELGAWGVDTVNNLVWAVIDHNSDFVTVVPEPGTYALLLFGGAAFYGLRLRNRKNS